MQHGGAAHTELWCSDEVFTIRFEYRDHMGMRTRMLVLVKLAEGGARQHCYCADDAACILH